MCNGASANTHTGLSVDLRVVAPDQFGNLLQHFTGSKAHNVAIREAAVKRGLDHFGVVIVDESDGMGAGVRLKFTRVDTKQITRLEGEGGIVASDDAIERLAEIAAQVNERQENIGARRLHTVLERLLDTLSYEAPDRDGSRVTIDRAYVDSHLGELVQDPDLSRYIL